MQSRAPCRSSKTASANSMARIHFAAPKPTTSTRSQTVVKKLLTLPR